MFDPEDLADYFVENLRNESFLNVSTRQVWGDYFVERRKERSENDSWNPDPKKIKMARSNEEIDYDWSRLQEDFQNYVEDRIKDIESTSNHSEEIEQVLDCSPPFMTDQVYSDDLEIERRYNLGLVDTGDYNYPEDVLLTSVIGFYDPDIEEKYVVETEFLGEEESLKAIDKMLALDQREEVVDLIDKGVYRGQAEEALKVYDRILEGEEYEMARDVMTSIRDEEVRSEMKSKFDIATRNSAREL